MMDPAIKAKWLKALRSGEYQQGTGDFYLHGRYCCLGVLLEISGENPYFTERYPSEFWEFGLSSKDGCEFANLNDSGATFDQIALAIENCL